MLQKLYIYSNNTRITVSLQGNISPAFTGVIKQSLLIIYTYEPIQVMRMNSADQECVPVYRPRCSALH